MDDRLEACALSGHHIQERPPHSPTDQKPRFREQVLLFVCTSVQPDDSRDEFQKPTRPLFDEVKSLHFALIRATFSKASSSAVFILVS